MQLVRFVVAQGDRYVSRNGTPTEAAQTAHEMDVAVACRLIRDLERLNPGRAFDLVERTHSFKLTPAGYTEHAGFRDTRVEPHRFH